MVQPVAASRYSRLYLSNTLKKLLAHHLNESSFVTVNIKKIFDNYPGVQFHDGLPEVSSFDGKKRTLFVMDDLMTSMDDRVVDIFTKISHHWNLSVYLTQNLFYKNKQTRTLSLNSHYIVLFKNASDATQVNNRSVRCTPVKVHLWSRRVLHTGTFWSI